MDVGVHASRFRVGSVGFLNPVPLVWGMLHGPQKERVDLSFSLPSVCSQQLETGEIEVGLVPVAEIARQGLEIIPGVGITCFGSVRSILLVSKVPVRQIKVLAADSSSRTSIELVRVILRERYGCEPRMVRHAPVLDEMLAEADAAVIIGDPALHIDPITVGYECLDLGEEWRLLTGLPMVFAAWAGKAGLPFRQLEQITRGSYEYGAARIDEIVESEHHKRGISKDLADRYLRQYIRYKLGKMELQGLETFLAFAGLPRPVGAKV